MRLKKVLIYAGGEVGIVSADDLFIGEEGGARTLSCRSEGTDDHFMRTD